MFTRAFHDPKKLHKFLILTKWKWRHCTMCMSFKGEIESFILLLKYLKASRGLNPRLKHEFHPLELYKFIQIQIWHLMYSHNCNLMDISVVFTNTTPSLLLLLSQNHHIHCSLNQIGFHQCVTQKMLIFLLLKSLVDVVDFQISFNCIVMISSSAVEMNV